MPFDYREVCRVALMWAEQERVRQSANRGEVVSFHGPVTMVREFCGNYRPAGPERGTCALVPGKPCVFHDEDCLRRSLTWRLSQDGSRAVSVGRVDGDLDVKVLGG